MRTQNQFSLKLLIASVAIIGTFFFLASKFHDHFNVDVSKKTTNELVVEPVVINMSENTKELQHNVSRPDVLTEPPSTGYPIYTSLLDTISKWNPDNPEFPFFFKETLQHFNYSDPIELSYAEKFRNAELPFKLYGISDIQKVSEKWNDIYLAEELKNQSPHVEQSKTNHFMYWNENRHRGTEDFKPPTDVIKMKFSEWLNIAKEADDLKLNNASTHYYFMTGASASDNGRTFLSRDLPMFSTQKDNFFISNVAANKGIQCRFGMRGIIAEAHYDSGRNMVAMLKGAKRYILNPPKDCKKLGIISDIKHPSYRHSVIDWSDVSQATSRGFASVDAIDTIVQAGEVLYIPSYWFHYIVSLKYSIQCNSRSGSPPNGEGKAYIDDCLGSENKWEMGTQRKKPKKRKTKS